MDYKSKFAISVFVLLALSFFVIAADSAVNTTLTSSNLLKGINSVLLKGTVLPELKAPPITTAPAVTPPAGGENPATNPPASSGDVTFTGFDLSSNAIDDIENMHVCIYNIPNNISEYGVKVSGLWQDTQFQVFHNHVSSGAGFTGFTYTGVLKDGVYVNLHDGSQGSTNGRSVGVIYRFAKNGNYYFVAYKGSVCPELTRFGMPNLSPYGYISVADNIGNNGSTIKMKLGNNPELIISCDGTKCTSEDNTLFNDKKGVVKYPSTSNPLYNVVLEVDSGWDSELFIYSVIPISK